MTQNVMQEAEDKMKKSIGALKNELTRLRTGRAHPSLLDHIRVKYYDNEVPLNQVGNVAVENSRTLMVTPWEKALVPEIEKAIRASELGLNPTTAGTVIRI